MVPKISCLYATAAILDAILDFERKQWFSSVASGFIGLSIYQNPYIPIFMLSARSEHVWHISAPLNIGGGISFSITFFFVVVVFIFYHECYKRPITTKIPVSHFHFDIEN